MTEVEKAFIVEYLRGTQRKLKEGADYGILRIIRYGIERGYSIQHIAYLLATVWHETAAWMQPIREGCSRNGPAGTDAQAVAAIQAAINRGLIKSNYLVLNAGKRHYGRGLVQITWLANYLKFEKISGKPLVLDPDLALDWDMALFILYYGCSNGLFTGKKLSDYITGPGTLAAYTECRRIVNGDIVKNGKAIGLDALVWEAYLGRHYAALKAEYVPTPVGFGVLGFITNLLKGFLK